MEDFEKELTAIIKDHKGKNITKAGRDRILAFVMPIYDKYDLLKDLGYPADQIFIWSHVKDDGVDSYWAMLGNFCVVGKIANGSDKVEIYRGPRLDDPYNPNNADIGPQEMDVVLTTLFAIGVDRDNAKAFCFRIWQLFVECAMKTEYKIEI